MLCLTLSIGCSKSLVRTEYIKQTLPAKPVPPEYYPVEWTVDEEGNYQLDEKNAKNLLKNMALMRDYLRQWEKIYEGGE
jgi:hypothetical protein